MSAKTLTRVQFYRRKWLKEHVFEFITLALILAALIGAGAAQLAMRKDTALWCFGAAAAVLVAGIFFLRSQLRSFLAENTDAGSEPTDGEPDFDPAEFEAEAEQAAREAEAERAAQEAEEAAETAEGAEQADQ